ncbi:cell wall-binding repeat-containing protein [Thermoleophilia bacterium SCSIO 60948]|nr:cell wall-binding repeat-containing protein [Thermoleophilia bacterium SCSIO 60948]
MRRNLLIALAVLVALAAGFFGARVLDSDEEGLEAAPGPPVIVRELPAPEETEELGYPAFATKNTTRVAGQNSVASAAGVALATYPATGGSPSPDAVSLVDSEDWPSGIASASLMASPIGAPMLVTDGPDLPELTANAITQLDPTGSADTDGAQAFEVGIATAPEELRSETVDGRNPAEVAVGVAKLRARLTGEDPEAVVVTTSDDADYAMPAAGWAARSGDPVLFTGADSLSPETERYLEELAKDGRPDVYVLGPEAAISEKVFDQIDDVARGARRIEGENPVQSAIEFARFADGDFGWDINDPGHGFVVANVERPLDAGAAAPLSASGTWGPLLVTDDADGLPPDLRAYLLDLKPGFVDDPTRALYNHVWVIGDERTISVALQAALDEVAEVAPVSRGAGSISGEEDTAEPQDAEDEQRGDGGSAQADDAADADADDDGADAGSGPDSAAGDDEPDAGSRDAADSDSQ